jgi:hypothetical protein
MRGSIHVSCAKVAEWQRRGTTHFHAVIRFDSRGRPIQPRSAHQDHPRDDRPGHLQGSRHRCPAPLRRATASHEDARFVDDHWAQHLDAQAVRELRLTTDIALRHGRMAKGLVAEVGYQPFACESLWS